MQSCLICDDHAMIREALAGLIRMNWPDAEVTLASDFPSAYTQILQLPDICLCDLSMPGAEPLEGIRRLKSLGGDIPVLVITASEDDALLVDLFRAGIVGFVPKTSRTAIIEAAIRIVLAGGQYVPARVLELASTSNHADAKKSGRTELPSTRLTERQIEVLRLVGKGRSNKEIARDLNLSPATVKAHIAAVLGVLGATNRTEAVMIAERLRLV